MCGGTGGQAKTADSAVWCVRESMARDYPRLHNHQEYTSVVLLHDALPVSLSVHDAGHTHRCVFSVHDRHGLSPREKSHVF